MKQPSPSHHETQSLRGLEIRNDSNEIVTAFMLLCYASPQLTDFYCPEFILASFILFNRGDKIFHFICFIRFASLH